MPLYRLFFIALLAGLGNGSSAQAEAISYCGLNLTADQLRPIDNNNVKVSYAGEQVIIPNASVEHWLAERSLLDAQRLSKFSSRELGTFSVQCSDSEAMPVVAAAIVELLRRGDPQSFSSREFFDHSKRALDTMAAALEAGPWEKLVREGKSPGQIRLLSEALAEMFVRNPAWVKSKSLRLFYLLSEPISALLLMRVREELDSNNIRFLEQVGEAYNTLGDTQAKDSMLFQEAARLITELDKNGFDDEAVGNVIASARRVPALLDLLYPTISKKIKNEIESQKAAGKIEQALATSNLLLPSRSSPELLALMRELLATVVAQPQLNLDERAYGILDQFAKRDPLLAQSYQRLLEARLMHLVEGGKVTESEKFLSHLVVIRPDPNKENDDLRYKQALAYKEQDLVLMAQDKLAQIQSGVGVTNSVRLMLVGSMWGPVLLGGLIFLTLAGLCWFFFRDSLKRLLIVKARPAKAKAVLPQRHVAKEESAEESRTEGAATSSFVRLDPLRAQNPIQSEYESKLAQFSLRRDAPLRNIKSAYRNAVKDCHPDLNPNQGREKIDRFAQLTKTYEEILELRKQLGMPD